MKKEARYQMSIEKGLGFYKPKFIEKWINEKLPGSVSSNSIGHRQRVLITHRYNLGYL